MKRLVLVLGSRWLSRHARGRTRSRFRPAATCRAEKRRRDRDGTLVEVKPEQVVVETRDGTKIQVPRSDIGRRCAR